MTLLIRSISEVSYLIELFKNLAKIETMKLKFKENNVLLMIDSKRQLDPNNHEDDLEHF